MRRGAIRVRVGDFLMTRIANGIIANRDSEIENYKRATNI